MARWVLMKDGGDAGMTSKSYTPNTLPLVHTEQMLPPLCWATNPIIYYESIQFAREPMDWGSAVKSGTVFARSSRPYPSPSPLALGMLLVMSNRITFHLLCVFVYCRGRCSSA